MRLPAVLSVRPYRGFLAAVLISTLGGGVSSVALAFAVLDLTGSATDLGVVLAANGVGFAAFLLPAGVWTDRGDRMRILTAAEVGVGACQAIVAALILSHRATIPELVVLSGGMGIGMAYSAAALGGILPLVLNREDLQQGLAVYYATGNAAGAVGPLLGGLIVTITNPGYGLAVDATSFFAAAAILTRVHPVRSVPRSEASPDFVSELSAGIRAIRDRPWALWFLVSAGVFVFSVLAPWNVLGPYVANNRLGGAASWGVISSAYLVGTFIAASAGIRWRMRRPLRTGSIAMGMFAVLPLTLAMSNRVVVIAAAAVLGGAANELSTLLWDLALQREMPVDLLSRVASLDWFANRALKPVALAAVGPLINHFGVTAVLVASAAMAVITATANLAYRPLRELSMDAPASP